MYKCVVTEGHVDNILERNKHTSLQTKFQHNGLIVKFNELNHFGVTTLGGASGSANSSQFTGTLLTEIGLEKIASLTSGYSLAGLSQLKAAYFPNLTTISARYAMQYCTSMERLEVGEKLTNLSFGIWQRCSSLTIAIFRSVTPPTASTNNFASTPIASGNGYIYVPDDSVEAYKAATNWSTYASKIKGLSELDEQ